MLHRCGACFKGVAEGKSVIYGLLLGRDMFGSLQMQCTCPSELY